MSQTKITMEEDMFERVPKHTSSWLKNIITMYYFKGSWNTREYHEAAIFAQQCFKAQPSDVLLCSSPKTGTTWLKALAFAIVTREKFDISTSPLLTTLPHECIPNLISNMKEFEQGEEKRNNPLVATHFHYDSLPKSVIDSKCKIVYIYRNLKDVFVSYYNFIRDIVNLSEEDAPFNEAFDELYQGISFAGPYWDHILGYWKASVERPGTILFIKYEDLKKDPTTNVQKLAEFIGYPFSIDEINGGVVEKIINLCSFENLRNLEVNKSGKHQHIESSSIDNRLYFRKAKDGDWKNYFTKEMEEKVDKLIDEKLSGTGLVLK